MLLDQVENLTVMCWQRKCLLYVMLQWSEQELKGNKCFFKLKQASSQEGVRVDAHFMECIFQRKLYVRACIQDNNFSLCLVKENVYGKLFKFPTPSLQIPADTFFM